MSAGVLEPPYGARDPRDMAALIEALPEQIEQALARVGATPWQPTVRDATLLALGGMGGSAIAGELTAAAFADTLPRPFLVVRDYHWPACVDRDALAILSSNSGNTEETLALAAQAAGRGVPCAAMASGGQLAERAQAAGWPLHRLPGGMPPRAALFHAWVPLTTFVAALGWAPDPVPAWREAAVLLKARRRELGVDSPEAANPAKRLARAVAGRTLSFIRGPGRPPQWPPAGDNSSTKMLRCSPILRWCPNTTTTRSSAGRSQGLRRARSRCWCCGMARIRPRPPPGWTS